MKLEEHKLPFTRKREYVSKSAAIVCPAPLCSGVLTATLPACGMNCGDFQLCSSIHVKLQEGQSSTFWAGFQFCGCCYLLPSLGVSRSAGEGGRGIESTAPSLTLMKTSESSTHASPLSHLPGTVDVTARTRQAPRSSTLGVGVPTHPLPQHR